MSILIREMNLTDVDEVLSILKSTFKSYLHVRKEQLINSLSSANLFPYVAIYEGEIIGTATLIIYKRLSDGLTAVIEDVAICETRQGMGLGKIIINELIKNAYELGCFKLIAECKKDRIKFYEKSGLHSNSYIVKKILLP